MQRTSLKVADAAELATTVAGATMVSYLQAYVVNRLGFGRHQTYNSLEVSQRSPEHLLHYESTSSQNGKPGQNACQPWYFPLNKF